jgi:outer membrane immunogenic protein
MKKLTLHAMAITLLLGATAGAADLRRPAPVKAPAPPPVAVYNWTGCYVGAGGGYGMWNQKNVLLIDGSPASLETTNGGQGWFGTVQVGCDYQLSGNWVVGAFADSDFGNIKVDATPGPNVVAREKLKWSWAAGGRLGYVVLPNLLAYASGGFTQAHFDAAQMFQASDGAPRGFHFNAHTYSGWFLGTGYEYGLQWLPGLFLKTEYRYAKFRVANLPWVSDPPGVPINFSTQARTSEQTIRTELVWRFNVGGPVVARY